MHQAVSDFFETIRTTYPDFFYSNTNKIIECGSLNINGSIRNFFNSNFYIGVDVEFGNGVDLKSTAAELKFQDGFFDVVCSSEMLEHDLEWFASLNNMYRMLRSGGMMAITCATTGRYEHGTPRSWPSDAPFIASNPLKARWYKNLTQEDFEFALPSDWWAEFRYDILDFDLRFVGIKR